MDEYRATAALYARARVVIELDHEIVKGIGAFEMIGGTSRCELDRLIVATVSGILGPIRWASIPDRAENRSVSAVTGRDAAPASIGE